MQWKHEHKSNSSRSAPYLQLQEAWQSSREHRIYGSPQTPRQRSLSREHRPLASAVWLHEHSLWVGSPKAQGHRAECGSLAGLPR